MADIAVVGQIARDLVLLVDDLPDARSSTSVRQRKEMLGGKGANIAVGATQQGAQVALIGVVGADDRGAELLTAARADGLDVHGVQKRGTSGLIVNVLTTQGKWRYFEDLPELLTAADIAAAESVLRGARSVVLQLQQPTDAILYAARIARDAGARVVADGVPADHQDEILAAVDVLRVDHHEGELLTGRSLSNEDDALEAANAVLERGPSLVVMAVDPVGNLFTWPGGHLLVPLDDTPVVDTTGSGDALVATLTWELTQGHPIEHAARRAAAAASATVGHPGGRPDLG
ncbi:PfkB family carbohydrate kinase [Labedaea rhizosphaerae]|uniref:Ribokinase n=1 Tax=Labedaea rhizosphaerae TaxID=598644 RepID=A0A4R6RV40_LABRH|nr:PfkB family carbohydrate kinase [Labedaea rhizosphaerae]TDP89956.1 ribokinase [Labedaea rhizosphaerae]